MARRAFDAALGREYEALMQKTREMAGAMQDGADLWRLQDFLTNKRREIDRKYDYRYSQLIIVFGRLVHEGWLSLEELEGLHEDKLEKIRAILSLAEK